MKLITITDRQGTTHHINPLYIIRIEEYANMIIVFTSDGAGIRSDMAFNDLMKLLAG